MTLSETVTALLNARPEFDAVLRYVAIPQDFEIPDSDRMFDPHTMRALVELGRRMGANPSSWRTQAPQPGAPFRVGLIGTGRISDIYLKTCARFPELEIAVCGSLNAEEAKAKAAAYNVPSVAAPQDILAHESLDAILNLTIVFHLHHRRRLIQSFWV